MSGLDERTHVYTHLWSLPSLIFQHEKRSARRPRNVVLWQSKAFLSVCLLHTHIDLVWPMLDGTPTPLQGGPLGTRIQCPQKLIRDQDTPRAQSGHKKIVASSVGHHLGALHQSLPLPPVLGVSDAFSGAKPDLDERLSSPDRPRLTAGTGWHEMVRQPHPFNLQRADHHVDGGRVEEEESWPRTRTTATTATTTTDLLRRRQQQLGWTNGVGRHDAVSKHVQNENLVSDSDPLPWPLPKDHASPGR
ncbi:uncharacterized protein PV06_08815 [Exophiala oligosperma]|uniref:Uncharacterized protein n=1 Tax=Exophiala oligosperma TaxID=215243 RepID=A0A0D2D7A3_9EURO|nr:uncharacterized protein PV06_08815 [Exophiala oligosperma]KIW38998.1 hypothetical protein PV06_08815 [Exophiala oligosperma]